MVKNHSIYKRLIFLVLMVVLSCTNVGYSSFQYISNSDTSNITQDFNSNSLEMKQVLVQPIITNQSVNRNYFDSNGSTSSLEFIFNLNSSSVVDQLVNIINSNKATSDSTFNNFINFDSEESGAFNRDVYNEILAGTYSCESNIENTKLVIHVKSTLTYESHWRLIGGTTTTYGGQFSIYLQSSDFTYILGSEFSINFSDTISLSEIEKVCIDFFANQNKSYSYNLIGFYDDFQNNEPVNRIDNEIFETNTLIYAAFYLSQELESNEKISITKTINNNTSGNLTFYLNSSFQNNIGIDYSYNEITNSFNLGFTNQATTIASGTTVDFSLNDGFKLDLNDKDYQPPSAPSYANPDTQQNSKQYTIKLINDLYINGTLNLHSKVGNNTSSSMQSSINGGYVSLDLNGHNIYISSTGTLNSYGIIEDSVGNGTINVSVGGTLASYVTIEDYKSGTSTTELVEQKIFPFTNYFFPYLRCKIFIECTKNTQNIISTGAFNGIVSLKLINNITQLGNLGIIPIANMTLNFIGTGDNTFFKINNVLSNNADIISGVYLNFHFNENTNFDDFSTTSNEYRYLTTIRNKRNFVNLDISLSKLTMDVAGALGGFFETILGFVGSLPSVINTDEYVFPLPSYFDLNFTNSIFRFSQPVQILPGASLYFDENCFVYLEYNTSRSAGLYSSGDAYNTFRNGTFNNNRKVSTSTSTNDLSSAGLFNTESIWKYSNQPSINCLGTIVFTKGNTVSSYVLVGNINFNKVAICESNGSNLQELEVDKSQLFSTLQTNGVNVKTYSYFIYPGNENMVAKAYTLPLISYDNAYVYNSDGSYNLYGSYNQNNGIFTDSNGLNYFFLNDQTFSLTNTSTTLAQLKSFDSTQNFITYNGSNYVYFGGCYWLATTISGNSATININKANNSSTTANVTYDTTNYLWLK